jgi:hypothetical protein
MAEWHTDCEAPGMAKLRALLAPPPEASEPR